MLTGRLVCGAAFWPICDSIPFCAKAEKEHAKRTKVYLQWNEVLGGNIDVSVLDFSWGGRACRQTGHFAGPEGGLSGAKQGAEKGPVLGEIPEENPPGAEAQLT